MRFRPEQHLRRQSDFRAVRETGRRVDCGAFTVWWRRRPTASADAVAEADTPPLPTVGLPRVGVVASTAAVGAAVQRNRAKRRLREIFRHHQPAVPADCDLLLVARAAVNRWDYRELEQKFLAACQRIPRPAPSVDA